MPSPGTSHHTERNPVNKSELVSAIAKRADVPASTVNSVVDALQEELVDAITRGEKVAVSGLLTVERTQRSARTGRNPRTGAHVSVDKKSVPFFKTGKEMRERLNKAAQ